MCSDGKVRALARIAETADTFYSVPAAVTVCADGQRWTVTGYISTESEEGWTVETADTDPTIVKFTAYSYGRNADRLPAGSWKR